MAKQTKQTSRVESAKKTTKTTAKRSKESEIAKQAVNHMIGKAIAKYRKAAGLSQEALAEKLGLGNEAISRMERGLVIPTVERLIKMAEIFDCPVSELLTETSSRPTDEMMHVYYLLTSVSEENKAWLIQQLEQWVLKLSK